MKSKLLLPLIMVATLAVFLFSFSNAFADCGNMTGDCDNNGNSNYNNAGVQEDDGYIDDNNNGVNDENENSLPVDSDQSPFYNNYYKHHSHEGVDDSESNIDDIHLGSDNHNHDNDNKGSSNDNDNHKSSSSSSVEKFKVHVYVDFGYAQSGDNDRIRVIVYGPHTLNKPTLDKPGILINLGSCGRGEVCYQDVGIWTFSDWKVNSGDKIKACALNTETSNQDCGYGTADKSRTDTIHIPVSTSTEIQTLSPGGGKQDFRFICQNIQKFLINDCNVYLKPDGTLTNEGTRAHNCILSGGLLAGYASLLQHQPPNVIRGILEPLSEKINCGSIVKWQELEYDVGGTLVFLNILGLVT